MDPDSEDSSPAFPYVILHNAVSIDGRLDWFEADLGAYYGLAAAMNADIILAGSRTLVAAHPPDEDDPTLSEPPGLDPKDPRPLLAVVDSLGRVKNWKALRESGYWKGFVALVSRLTPVEYVEYLMARHIAVIIAGEEKVDLREGLWELAARFGAKRIRVDSGGILNGVLLRAGLVDEVHLLIHPALVGGSVARSIFVAPDLNPGEDVITAELRSVERMEGGLVHLTYHIDRVRD